MVSPLSNPFPVEAVATYGVSLRTCEELGYMMRARSELNDYLVSYSKSETRYGGAVGLRGGHGSGKTHLLTWLAQKASEFRTVLPACLYAKADTPSFFDLYKQLLSQIDRSGLIHLLDRAILNVAIDQVKRARVTENIEKRISKVEDLSTLYKEANLDPSQVTNELETRLTALQIPNTIAQTLLRVHDSGVGEDAYRWLLGDTVLNLPALGLAHQFRQPQEESLGSSVPDETAVHALEALAAVHRIAGVPLIVFVDQLEILLRTDPARQQVLFSVTKKLIEHLGRQHSLLFLAGADEAWKKLPRDVPPRLRQREPLQVGNLSSEETKAFIEAYSAGFSSSAIRIMHELSGGNPRELLRIAYYAFEKTGGATGSVPDTLLLQSAQESGTVKDRQRLALEIADGVLARYGEVGRDLTGPPGITIDRMLKKDAIPFLGLVVARATDKLSEVHLARWVQDVRQYLAREWPGTHLVVVAVGYSSKEVRDLLGQTSSTLLFQEPTFEGEFETIVAKAAAERQAEKPQQGAPDSEVLSMLQQISARLVELDTKRKAESEKVQERFARAASDLAEPQRKERELRSRWQILRELAELRPAADYWDMKEERERFQAILTANEAHLGNQLLDQIGILYLEVLVLQEQVMGRGGLVEPLLQAREEMAAELRHRVQRVTPYAKLLEHPYRSAAIGGFAAAISVLLFFTDDVFRYGFEAVLQYGALMLWVGLASATGILLNLTFFNPVQRWDRRVRLLRRSAASPARKESAPV